MKHIKFIWIIIFIFGTLVRGTYLFHPIDTESWRESDVATIARNFYHNGMNIFQPQIAWDGIGPGYTESEFQIYGYLIAFSYKLFGYMEPVGRIISLLFSLASLIVFFLLSQYLLDTKKAIVASAIFAFSPILMVISVGIQPEAIMFFFYLLSAYLFIKWLDVGTKKYFAIATLCTALALLTKITAANIGLFFLLLIIFKKGWRFLFNKYVILFGIMSLLPSVLWYTYAHQFYVLYGNSLGISNEHSWIGWDFFTDRRYIEGLVKIELFHVWTYPGVFIVLIGFVSTKILKNKKTIMAILWFSAVLFFYLISIKTTSQEWAYYYHIFSIPAAAILIGSSIIEIFNKYIPKWNSRYTTSYIIMLKSRIVITLSGILILLLGFSCLEYLVKEKSSVFQSSSFYACRDELKKIIPPNSILLANGGPDTGRAGYPLAYNSSYFFYWLNLKGYNISIEKQSIISILKFRKKGVKYFLAEERILNLKPGFEQQLRNRFSIIYHCNGCLLFKI